jgi:hypothetical protein
MDLVKVWRVAWPCGVTYFGVRPADTAASLRSKLRTAATRPVSTSRLARACRDLAVENATVEEIASFGEEAAALHFANGLIAALPGDKRLNTRNLSANSRRSGGSR